MASRAAIDAAPPPGAGMEDFYVLRLYVSAGTPTSARAVVNVRRGEQLGMPARNALLVDTGEFTPSKLTDRFKAVLDAAAPEATLQVVALEFENDAQTAVLTGASVSDASVDQPAVSRGSSSFLSYMCTVRCCQRAWSASSANTSSEPASQPGQ